MSKVRQFEDLECWQLGRELAKAVFQLTENSRLAKNRALSWQIIRSSISIPSNIAEGFEREEKKEFIQFLYIAKGSAGELRTQLRIASDCGLIAEARGEELDRQCLTVSRKIARLIRSLKESNISGQKFQSEK